MSEQVDENLTEVFKSLSHPLRQDIINILADRQNIGFTALQKELNRNEATNKPVQVGSIYHHLALLGDLIIQEGNSKSWSLSERGWFAYNLLTTSKDRDQFMTRGDLARKSIFSLTWRVLAPPELFLYAKKSLVLFLGWQIIFFWLFAVVASQTDLVLIFVFFHDLNPEKDLLLSLVSILLSWLLFTVIILLLSKQFLRKRSITKEDIVTVVIFIGISMLPLVIFPLFILANLFNLSQPYIPLTLAIILQLWVILLAARSISVQFFVRMERSGIISIISIYMMVILSLILGF
ncbi:MAG: hypothetical protein ACXAEU_04145 [Candidatus Hodarchaeales archaeon]|jgi:hypothetical protein